MKAPDFVLAGLTSWAPLDDRPLVGGPYRWFVEGWTGPLPNCEAFTESWGVQVQQWPRNLSEQIQLALTGKTIVLVSGDPMVATPHEHLLKALRSKGLNCLVRRRPGVIDLVAKRLGQRPRVLPASAERDIESHLAGRTDPLLIVEDDQRTDLWALATRWKQPGWQRTGYTDLGTAECWEGAPENAPTSRLRCLVFQGD